MLIFINVHMKLFHTLPIVALCDLQLKIIIQIISFEPVILRYKTQ